MTLFGLRPKKWHISVPGKVAGIFFSQVLFLNGKKLIKNIGERILVLSIAVFCEFAIENCKGGNSVNKEILEKTTIFNLDLSKNDYR